MHAHFTIRGGLLLAIGLALWGLVFVTTQQPRAGYDTLWYTRFAFEYAGESRQAAIEGSWRTFETYGDPERVEYIRERHGWPWQGEDDASRRRWVGIYRMRPLMPLVAATAVPLLGSNAPLVPSALAVVILVAGAALVLGRASGPVTASVFVALGLLNPEFSGWLVHLTTDGLGIGLWFLVLALGARYVHGGHRPWLVGLCVAALALAFTRQTVTIMPLTFGLAALVALPFSRPAASRLGWSAAAAIPALIIFTAFTLAAGLPSASDLLQDAPTTHFARPDVPDPIGYILARAAAQLPILISTVVDMPLLWGGLLLAVIGYAVRPRAWALPFLCSLATIPLLYFAHPILTEASRTLAPAWIGIHLGVAMLVGRLAASLGPTPSPAEVSGAIEPGTKDGGGGR